MSMPIFSGLSEKVLRKLHAQEDKITGSKETPRNQVVAGAKKELEDIYHGSGRVNPKYAKETVIAYGHSVQHHHRETDNSMLEDIIADKHIDFYDYV